MTSNNSRDPNLGRRLIDQYVLVERIGGGGMGDVYLAEQPSMGRRAVVKLLHAELSRDAQIAARFNLEARSLAALAHPHIVTVYNYGADGGALFLAMEFLDGKDLDVVLRDSGPLPPARAVAIARQICAALAAAHARGVVHRDLKPSNVMLVGQGRDFVKVLDFGVAKVQGVALTAAGTVFGTPEYMSPEQLRGEPLDGRCDLYSLAILLFELVAGRLPFERDSPEGYMAAQLNELPPSLEELAPEVPPALASLVARTLAKDRAARPASADELARLLEAAMQETPSTAVGGKRSSRKRARPSSSSSSSSGEGGGLRAAIVGGAVGMLALLALTAVLLFKRPPAPRLPIDVVEPPQRRTPSPTLNHPVEHPKNEPPKNEPPKNEPPKNEPPKSEPPAESGDARAEAEQLERRFLNMESRLSVRERRAALKALYARIDAAPGTPAERARMRVSALDELIRQHGR